MNEKFPGSYHADTGAGEQNAGRRRAQGMMQLMEQEDALRKSDPVYDDFLRQHETASAERNKQLAASGARDAELLASLPGSPEGIDEEFGPGTSLRLARGEITWRELNSEPSFNHASTGDQMNLADVKGRLSSAEEQNAEALGKEIGAKASRIREDVQKIKRVDSKRVHTETIDAEGSPVVAESMELDSDHIVEAVSDGSGRLVDVRIIAAGITSAGSVEEHFVDVRIDNSPGQEKGDLFVDGAPADPEELSTAQAVIEHTVEQLDAQVLVSSRPDQLEQPEQIQEVEQPEQTNESVQSNGPINSKAHEKISPKLQFTGQARRYINGGIPEKVLSEVAQGAGVDLADFRDRLSSGEITFDKESYDALQQLQRDGLKPGSPEWSVDPRNPSGIGAVSRESRQLLAKMLQQASR